MVCNGMKNTLENYFRFSIEYKGSDEIPFLRNYFYLVYSIYVMYVRIVEMCTEWLCDTIFFYYDGFQRFLSR